LSAKINIIAKSYCCCIVSAGEYGLLTIPESYQWTIIITKQLDVTSPAAYKQDQDVARIKVNTVDLDFSLESFTIMFDNISGNSLNMMIGWDRKLVMIPITTEIDSKISAQIESLKGKENFPYFNAAVYYLEKEKDLNTALTWFDKAAQQSPDAFWIFYQKAKCEAKLGKKKEAIATANKSIELATKAKNDDYVTLNKKLIDTLK
jgi:tetratricopeptide (TPR) repeat protein